MLLAHKIPEKDLKWFRDKGILVKKCRPIYDKTVNGYPPVVLDKFHLFTPEFKKWKTVIYIDDDIIVRHSLDLLCNINGFNACKDLVNLKSQFKENNPPDDLLNKLDMKTKSFNTGILAFNTDLISQDTFKDLNILFRRYVSCTFGEQTILNIYFYKKWSELPAGYNTYVNCLTSGFRKRKFLGVNVHFARKEDSLPPWDSLNLFNLEWKKNLERFDTINLKQINDINPLSQRKLRMHSLFLKGDYAAAYFGGKFRKSLDRIIGVFGKIVKKFNPLLYDTLKSSS